MIARYFKIARYIISGGTATAVAIGLLYFFTHYLHIWYLASSIIAYALAFLVSFSFQKFWTFQSSSLHMLKKEVVTYLTIFICNIAFNTFFIYMFVEFLHLHYVLAQISSSFILACTNFFLYKYVVFVHDEPQLISQV